MLLARCARIEEPSTRSLALYDDEAHFMTVLLAQMARRGAEEIARLSFDMEAIGAGYHLNLIPVFAHTRAA